jgi:hypothetical protein
MQKYLFNKNMYLRLSVTHGSISGGGKSKSGSIIKKSKKHEDQIYGNIDQIAKKEINELKTIGMNDLSGLNLRVYERNGEKSIGPIIFRTPNIIKYLDTLGTNQIDQDDKCRNGCVIDPDSFKYLDYYDQTHGDIAKNNLKNLVLDFGTKEKNLNLAFHDNYVKDIKQTFEIQLPIKLVDFIEKVFDHFDKVNLIGYPDNGGIDGIKYDKKNKIYLIYTWS